MQTNTLGTSRCTDRYIRHMQTSAPADFRNIRNEKLPLGEPHERSQSHIYIIQTSMIIGAIHTGDNSVCFLDIEKCFDTIDHHILLQKLRWCGIDDHYLDCFEKLHLWSQIMCLCWQLHCDIRCYVMSYRGTTGLYSGPYSFPIICKWLCRIYWKPKLQHFCRRCHDLFFWHRYSRNRIKVAMCVKHTYAMVLRK